MEIERKFLLTHLPPELHRYPHQRLAQGYLISAGEDLEVRLRARDGHNLLTIKQGGGLTPDEHEMTVEPARFTRLWPLTEGHRIEKVRYLIPAQQCLTIELDAYAGALDGLVTAEVEFDSEAQAQRFTPPAWFGPEVTGDPRYSNQRLAEEGLPRASVHQPTFSLDPGAPLGEGLGRLVGEQIDLATEQLSGKAGGDPAETDPAEAVHEARKSFKRVRATLKLARDQLQRESTSGSLPRSEMPVDASPARATVRFCSRHWTASANVLPRTCPPPPSRRCANRSWPSCEPPRADPGSAPRPPRRSSRTSASLAGACRNGAFRTAASRRWLAASSGSTAAGGTRSAPPPPVAER